MQRLFTTFAGGWPGVGLLLLRLLAGAALIHFGVIYINQGPPWMVVLQAIGIAAAIFLLLGLFTPIAGALATLAKASIAIGRFALHTGDPWIALAQATLAAVLAMIGPGVWSVDARRFGRKHIDL